MIDYVDPIFKETRFDLGRVIVIGRVSSVSSGKLKVNRTLTLEVEKLVRKRDIATEEYMRRKDEEYDGEAQYWNLLWLDNDVTMVFLLEEDNQLRYVNVMLCGVGGWGQIALTFDLSKKIEVVKE